MLHMFTSVRRPIRSNVPRLVHSSKGIFVSTPILPFLIIGQSLAEGRGANPSPTIVPAGKGLRYYAGASGFSDANDPIYPGHTQTLPAPVTIGIGSPTVIYDASSPPVGSAVFFSTTGALPTGIAVNTIYYVIASGNNPGVSYEISATV